VSAQSSCGVVDCYGKELGRSRALNDVRRTFVKLARKGQGSPPEQTKISLVRPSDPNDRTVPGRSPRVYSICPLAITWASG